MGMPPDSFLTVWLQLRLCGVFEFNACWMCGVFIVSLAFCLSILGLGCTVLCPRASKTIPIVYTIIGICEYCKQFKILLCRMVCVAREKDCDDEKAIVSRSMYSCG